MDEVDNDRKALAMIPTPAHCINIEDAGFLHQSTGRDLYRSMIECEAEATIPKGDGLCLATASDLMAVVEL